MVAFEVHGDPHEVIARRTADHPGRQPRQRRHAHPAPGLHQPPHRGPEGTAAARASSDRLLRLSVGLEDVEDLWQDLRTALGAGGAAVVADAAASPAVAGGAEATGAPDSLAVAGAAGVGRSAETIPSPGRGVAAV